MQAMLGEVRKLINSYWYPSNSSFPCVLPHAVPPAVPPLNWSTSSFFSFTLLTSPWGWNYFCGWSDEYSKGGPQEKGEAGQKRDRGKFIQMSKALREQCATKSVFV